MVKASKEVREERKMESGREKGGNTKSEGCDAVSSTSRCDLIFVDVFQASIDHLGGDEEEEIFVSSGNFDLPVSASATLLNLFVD